MGEVGGDTMTKKKKKGRPSLLDLQKRALKQQQLQQLQNHQDGSVEDHRSGSKNPNSFNHAPNSSTRSKRRNHNPNGVSSDSPNVEDNDEDDDERRDKKHRLLHGLTSTSHRCSPNSQSGGSDLNLDEAGVHGSHYTGEKSLKVTDILQESGPTTPLPDKKLLEFILDRLQKKDTYGVYSDPVDPEELPDYHEIITNPMDFSTVRKKLDSGAYANLEQFESDVFLICTNAMEYNSADTVYYRQARAILELSKKDFENLRQDSDDEEPQNHQQQQHQQQQQQPKVARRGRPPKKQPEPSSEISADALIPGAYNLRKTPTSYKFHQSETLVRNNHNSEIQSGSIDWENEFPASVVKAVNKYGMKHFNVDDNRRDTYNHLSTSTQEPSVLTTLEDELKQLIPVGLNTEYGYARSLARYAANLGPVAWKIASRKIGTVLPSGVKFGIGWVGENTTVTEEDKSQKPILLLSEKQKCSDDNPNRILSPTASVSSATAPPPPPPENEQPSSSSRPLINHESSNTLLGGFRHNPMLGIAKQQQQGLFPYNKQEFHRFPPDLNTRLVSPNSPNSNPQTGSSSSQHPDLALQL